MAALSLGIVSLVTTGTLLAASLVEPAAEPDEARGLLRYETEVRALLAERCLRCHGRERQKSGLRLDDQSAMLRGGDRGPALVPGHPERSLLMLAVEGHDPELKMPPKERLAPGELEALSAWIADGAPMPADQRQGVEHAPDEAGFDLWARAAAHWSFQPVADPAPPAVGDASWPRRDLDRFVLAGLEAVDLAPAPPADAETWLRRVSVALSGLPPEPSAQQRLLAEDTPATRDALVDELLDSPRFAETWARHWLDLVRYAETRGHEFDYPLPNTWQYRDWVIRALDADLPYDRFVAEQVAGDLLDPPRLHPTEGFDESVLGTGMWWLGEEVHSPVDIRLDETDRTANKLDVFGKAFLGLTVACARCHDHKFDPISTRDYYALSGAVISSRYRQVRFDTEVHNRGVAERLVDWELEHAESVLEALDDARRTHLEGQLPALLDAVRARAARPRRADRVVFDFEHATWDGWDVQGTAFGSGPRTVASVNPRQGDVRAVGQGLVDTHGVTGEESSVDADAHTGRLTSPEFVLDRRVLHLRVGGGHHPGKTCVQLLVDDAVAHEVTGHDGNDLRPVAVDVRPWAGRRARLRLLDEESGGWGQLIVDHVELSDDSRGRLGVDPAPDDWPAILEAAAHDVGHPLHALALLADMEPEARSAAVASWREAEDAYEDLAREVTPRVRRLRRGPPVQPLPFEARTLVDWTEDWQALELTDGPTFGLTTLPAGWPRFGDDPERPLLGVTSAPGAWARPEWSVLRVARGSEPDPSEIDWVQAGRTLHTPTFTLQHGRVAWLAVGAGQVHVNIDGHRMLKGPLHMSGVRRFEAGATPTWIEHDLTDYVGHRVHFEFSPRDARDPFAVLQVVEEDARRERRLPESVSLEGFADRAREEQRARDEEHAPLPHAPPWVPSSWDVIAHHDSLDEPTRRLLGSLYRPGSSNRDGRAYERFERWLAMTGPGLEHLDPAAAAALAERFALLAEIRAESRLAPALLDGDGVDEHVLLRGSARTPGELVPRRFLEALGGVDAAAFDSGHGSGRLDLARQLIDPDNPLVDRAAVNRVWHHLFGRGLVPSPDDLGAMAQPPSHPELLDALVQRFRADGRSLKALIREIVTSSTYAMASAHPDPRAAEVDADGRLRSSFAAQRLTAEALRDSLLAVSGRLDTTMFGPGVPIHLTDSLQGRGRPAQSGPLDGAGRRSIYLQVRRNFLVPFFLAFDFPSPFAPRARRDTSNVPAQALTLLHDPLVMELAASTGERLLAEHADDGARVDALWRLSLGRAPRDHERDDALAFVGGADVESRAVAWADLAHVVFALEEFRYLR